MNDIITIADSDSGVELSPSENILRRISLPAISEDNIEAYFCSLEFWFEASRVDPDATQIKTKHDHHAFF